VDILKFNSNVEHELSHFRSTAGCQINILLR